MKNCYLSIHLFLLVSKWVKFCFNLEHDIYAEGENLKHHNYIQGDSQLVDITAGGDFLGLCDQKS